MKKFATLAGNGVQKIFAELPKLKLPAIKDVYGNIPARSFSSKNIVIMRVDRRTHNTLHLRYFDEVAKAERFITVPNDLVFKTQTEPAKKLIKSYTEFCLKNLVNQMYWNGGKVGSDPEIFAEDKKGNIVSAFDFLGSKKKPSKAPSRAEDTSNYGKNNCYWDGFQAEFETHACNCMGWHSDSIQCGLEGVWTHLKKFNKDAKLSSKTVMDIPPKLMQKTKPEHAAFGCMPSKNVYGMKGLEADGKDVLYRAAGGHIHFGCGKLKPEELKRVVKALDAVLGVAAVSLFAKVDDPRRRQMYGLAGEHRTPAHGLEYRVLSNAWLFHPVLANIIFDLARGAFMFGKNDFLKFWNGTEEETIECINECNVALARKIMKRNKKLLIQIIMVKQRLADRAEWIYQALLGGQETIIKDISDIEGNWHLGKTWKTHCGNKGTTVYNTLTVENGYDMKKKIPKV